MKHYLTAALVALWLLLLLATLALPEHNVYAVPGPYLVSPSPTPGSGTGLRGDYYDNADFTNFKLTRIDPTVNFNWGTGSPDPTIGPDTFSVRWTGFVQPRYSETYVFYTTSDDGIRLWVNGQQLINNWTDHAPTENSGTITLSAGLKYALRLEYYENSGGAVATLSWSSPSQSKQIIPAAQLYPAASGATATFTATSGANPPTPTRANTPGTGMGLRGDYYDNADFTNFKLTRIDPTVNFNWGTGSPDPTIGPDTFSVRWTGFVQPRYSESYVFYTTSDDGIRLWVNSQQLINNWTNHAPTENSGTITLSAGLKYALRLEYYENSGGAVATLSWSSPSQSKQIIPAAQLYPATSGATATFTATSAANPPTATRTNTPAATRTNTPAATRTNTPAATPTPTAIPACPTSAGLPPQGGLVMATTSHRIGVRVVNNVGEFYDRATGAKFIPRGNNYIRLADDVFCGGYKGLYHSVFDVGRYDPALTQQELAQMHGYGYNIVRVFLNTCCAIGIGAASGGLSSAYLDNVADFMQQAKANGIYVIFTVDDLPELGGYKHSFGSTSQIDVTNAGYMLSAGVSANRRFWQDFVEGLIARNAPLDTVFSYELRNEMFFWGKKNPFTLSSGLVTTANGNTYDMSDFNAKKRMLDENLVYWTSQVRSAILQVDPTALVAVGFFGSDHPSASSGFADRTIRPYYAFAAPSQGGSTIDFVDLHPYPKEYPLAALVQGVEMTGLTLKPIVIGEFGAFTGYYRTNSFAADAMEDWQVQSCQYGFDGWLLWTWDTNEQPELWNALSGGGLINQALSPVNRSDACAYASSYQPNLALSKTIVATSSQTGHPGANAVDGVTGDYWASNGAMPQSLQIDLGTASTIHRIRLVAYQSQTANTDVRIWGRPPGGAEQLLKEWVGSTYDGELLEYAFPSPITGIQYVRAEFAAGPSSVGLRELEIR